MGDAVNTASNPLKMQQTPHSMEQFPTQPDGHITGMSSNLPTHMQTKEMLLSRSASAAVFAPEFPTYHPIKLCLLGSAYSGKKTIAASIKDKYGDAVDVFDINEVVREALTYIEQAKTPQEEVDPKAKGKPKEAVADIFEGKDTVKYKEVAEALF